MSNYNVVILNFNSLQVILFLLVSKVECSQVVDSKLQEGIHLSDYCPKTDLCPEGSHVLCMYYNPRKEMGPKCRNARNISMTAELANKFLDITNAVRSKIARGHETGEGGHPLPRGYGIFRLKWDYELATFAQVLVNQCVLRHDHCRATKKFPNPSQVASAVRFSYPDWIPKAKNSNITEPGFNYGKVLYAAIQTLKSWYRQKSSVNNRMLNDYPDWEKQAPNLTGKLYTEMIYGPATHMGCGVSAYTEYAYYQIQPMYHNSIFFICNFSARPSAGGAVFNTVPPGDPTILNPCGCPAGSVDDEDCLCHEELKEPFQSLNLKEERTCPHGMQCDPTVVLLPIFTAEDAPVEKLITDDSRKYSNSTHSNQMDTIDSLEIFNNGLTEFKHTYRTRIKIPEDTTTARDTGINAKTQWKQTTPKNKQPIKNRHFGPKQNDIVNNEECHDDKDSRKLLQHVPRPSFFSKTPRFELPSTTHIFANKGNYFSKKDLVGSKQLVDKYLYRKENIVIPVKREKTINSYKIISDSDENKSVESVKNTGDFPHTLQNPLINNVEQAKVQSEKAGFGLDTVEHLISDNEYLENDLNPYSKKIKKPEVKSVTEESDNKLMALLDTLEQEVKHIELRDDEKQLFDAKIKKIYGKVVGKPVDNILEHKLDTGKRLDFGFRDIMQGYNPKNDIQVNKDTLDDSTFNVEHVQDFDKTNRQKNVYNERQEEKSYLEDFLNLQDSATKQPDINEYLAQSRKFGKSDRNVFNPNKSSKSYNNDVANKSYRRRNYDNLRQRNNNEIHSIEHFNGRHLKYSNGKDNDRKSQRRELLERYSLRKNAENTKIRSNADFKRTRPSYASKEFQNIDPLSIDRRKYYQNKLDSIQRNLKNVRRSNHKKDSPRHLRAMLPARSVNQMDSLYMPGRARILHAY